MGDVKYCKHIYLFRKDTSGCDLVVPPSCKLKFSYKIESVVNNRYWLGLADTNNEDTKFSIDKDKILRT